MKDNKPPLIKTRFRVAGGLVIGMIFGTSVTIVGYIWTWTLDWAEDDLNWLYMLIVTIVYAILVLGTIYMFILFWPVIRIDEKGLHKSLLGKHLKSISWDEIVEIKTDGTALGANANWVIFSKSEMKGRGIVKSRLRRDCIYLMYSIELDEAVEHFYGKPIIAERKGRKEVSENWRDDEPPPSKKSLTEKEEIPEVFPPPSKKSLSELAAEAKAEQAEKPPPTENPWDKYK